MSQLAFQNIVEDPFLNEDDPLIAPLMREQLEPMLGGLRDEGVGAAERALMRALMQDAVLCLIGEAAPANERPQLAAEARSWVESHSRAWIFSFESVCDALGLNSDYAREKLLAMADERTVTASGSTHRSGGTVRGMRGLRHGGQRPRKAIHFMAEERRGRRRKMAMEA